MKSFDPNKRAAKESGIFGLPFTVEEAKLVLLPVPWEVTTSYGGGASKGPQAIFQASKQVDLFDAELGNFFMSGIAMVIESQDILKWNDLARQIAQILVEVENTLEPEDYKQRIETVNAYSTKLNQYVYAETKHLLAEEKLVGVVGGDHSTPFGAILAFLEKYPAMGILHIDAHADLRRAFEGFEHSHASIMYNVISKTALNKLVQIGIRDYCEEEYDFIQSNHQRIQTFFDATLAEQKMSGKHWSHLCDDIIKHLPQEVYISFDIDGLDPRFCPNTGTPVPGGLDFNEALLLIKKVVQSGRKIIGFDLNEVSPGNKTHETNEIATPAAEWDANVGARLLYKLCGWTMAS